MPTDTRVAMFSTWDDEFDDAGTHRCQTRHAGTAVIVGGLSFSVDSPATGQEVCAVVNRLADDPEALLRIANHLSLVALRLASAKYLPAEAGA